MVGSLLLWSPAGAWFFPALLPDAFSLQAWLSADFWPFVVSIALGTAACVIARRSPSAGWSGTVAFQRGAHVPLIVPALPLAVGQYWALLNMELDGTASGLVWSHLLWVLPYMLLTLIGSYRAFDPRLVTTARALGHTRPQVFPFVKWPMLVKPALAALAVALREHRVEP